MTVAKEKGKTVEKWLECGYCGDTVEYDESKGHHVHTTEAERIKNISPGDFVSPAHNRAGTRVNVVDIIERRK